MRYTGKLKQGQQQGIVISKLARLKYPKKWNVMQPLESNTQA